jgi:hypothetical protein
MNKNIKLIKIVNCKNNNYNFTNHLDTTNTIIIKNCSNINIFVNSKINKIIVENSHFVNLNIYQLINGIEINKSKVIINPMDNYVIPIIELFKSSLYLVGDINIYLNQFVFSEYSDIYNIIV